MADLEGALLCSLWLEVLKLVEATIGSHQHSRLNCAQRLLIYLLLLPLIFCQVAFWRLLLCSRVERRQKFLVTLLNRHALSWHIKLEVDRVKLALISQCTS